MDRQARQRNPVQAIRSHLRGGARRPRRRKREKGAVEWIPKRPKRYYDAALEQLIAEKYLAKTEDELDIYTALGVGAVLEMEGKLKLRLTVKCHHGMCSL